MSFLQRERSAAAARTDGRIVRPLSTDATGGPGGTREQVLSALRACTLVLPLLRDPGQAIRSGHRAHLAALVRAAAARLGALAAMLIGILGALRGAGVAHLGTEGTGCLCLRAVPRHQRCRQQACVRAIDVQGRAVRHGTRVGALQARRSALIAHDAAIDARLDARAGFLLLKHGKDSPVVACCSQTELLSCRARAAAAAQFLWRACARPLLHERCGTPRTDVRPRALSRRRVKT